MPAMSGLAEIISEFFSQIYIALFSCVGAPSITTSAAHSLSNCEIKLGMKARLICCAITTLAPFSSSPLKSLFKCPGPPVEAPTKTSFCFKFIPFFKLILRLFYLYSY